MLYVSVDIPFFFFQKEARPHPLHIFYPRKRVTMCQSNSRWRRTIFVAADRKSKRADDDEYNLQPIISIVVVVPPLTLTNLCIIIALVARSALVNHSASHPSNQANFVIEAGRPICVPLALNMHVYCITINETMSK